MTSQRSASASWRTNPRPPPRFQPCLQPDTASSLTLDEQAGPGTVVAQLERTPSHVPWHSIHNVAKVSKPVRVGSMRGEPASLRKQLEALTVVSLSGAQHRANLTIKLLEARGLDPCPGSGRWMIAQPHHECGRAPSHTTSHAVCRTQVHARDGARPLPQSQREPHFPPGWAHMPLRLCPLTQLVAKKDGGPVDLNKEILAFQEQCGPPHFHSPAS